MHTKTTSPVPHASNETIEAVRLALEAVRGLKERVKLAAPDNAIPAVAEPTIKDWPWPYPADFVTERALVHRINRALLWSAERLMKSRGARDKQTFGDWYILDLSTHSDPSGYHVIRDFIDLEALGREMDCLEPYEKIRP